MPQWLISALKVIMWIVIIILGLGMFVLIFGGSSHHHRRKGGH
jgi:amino acid permease